VRYAVGVLALVATSLAAYLTWTTFGQKPVVGCSETNVIGCDEVLGSTWSKFLGMPTSAPGALCYAAIFVLSLLAGGRSETASRLIGTLLVMLSLLAAGAAAWFVGLQLLVVQKICLFCMAVHACGLTIAGLVVWSAIRSREGQLSASQSAVALAGALSSVPRRSTQLPNPFAGPSLSVASIGAVVGLILLVGGQVMFPPKTYDVSTVTLDDPIEISSTSNAPNGSGADLSPDAQPHVAHRFPADDPPTADENETNESSDAAANGAPVDAEDASLDDADVADVADVAEDSSPAADSTPADAPPAATRKVSFLGGKLTVDLYAEAVLGSRDAPYVILELLDYTCPHCRKMHENIKLAERRYGDQLAIVVMPVPLELECNRRLPKTDPMHRDACRLARLAISVAQVDPSVFADFQNFLMRDEDNPPQYGTAVVRAFRLVNRDKLRELTKSDEIENRIQKYINLYANLAARQKSSDKPFGLPVQIVGDKVFTGKFDSPEEMFEAWEAEIDLRP